MGFPKPYAPRSIPRVALDFDPDASSAEPSRVPEYNAVTDEAIGDRTVDQATTHSSGTGKLTALLSLFAKRIKAMLGTSSWLDAVPATLTQLATHLAITAGNPHGTTAANVGAEPALGNPASSGQVLTSTTGGVRSWSTPSVSTSFIALTDTLDSSYTGKARLYARVHDTESGLVLYYAWAPSGTVASNSDRLARITDATNYELGNSLIRDDGTRLGFGTATVSGNFASFVTGSGGSDVTLYVQQGSSGKSAGQFTRGNGASTDNVPVLSSSQTSGTDGSPAAKHTQGGNGNCMDLEWNGSGTASSTTQRNYLRGFDSGGNKWRVDKTGKGFFNGGTQASGADFAELRLVEDDAYASLSPGDVLVWSTSEPGRVTASGSDENPLVAGVYSTFPGFSSSEAGIDDETLAEMVPVGFSGIVPCKVNDEGGAIAIGDFLVTSETAKEGMKSGATPAMGTVFAQALEAHAAGSGVIKVMLMKR